MSQIYCGLARRVIQHSLNSVKQQQKVGPLFQNKAPLRPIRASNVKKKDIKRILLAWLACQLRWTVLRNI